MANAPAWRQALRLSAPTGSSAVPGSLAAAFTLATVLGLVCSVAEIAGSYRLDLPTGPTIVAILAVVFGLSYLWATTRWE